MSFADYWPILFIVPTLVMTFMYEIVLCCLTALHTGMGLLFDGSAVCSVVLRVLHHSSGVADDAAEESGTVSFTKCMFEM